MPLCEQSSSQCSICMETYCNTSNQRPRTLTCGHTFCTGCLTVLLEKIPHTCPECRQNIPHSNIDAIPISYTIENILQERGQVNCVSTEPSGYDISISVGNCMEHTGAPRYFFCGVCRIFICSTCVLMYHPESPKGCCIIISAAHAIKELKVSTSNQSHDYIDKLTKFIEDQQAGIAKIDVDIKASKSLIQTHFAMIKQEEENIKSAEKRKILDLKEITETEKRLDNISSLTTSLNEETDEHLIAITMEEIMRKFDIKITKRPQEENISPSDNETEATAPRLPTVNFGNILSIVTALEQEASNDKYAYAVTSGQRYAKITSWNDYILVHSLDDTLSEDSVQLVQLSHLIGEIDPSQARVFMDIACGEQSPIRIVIRMTGVDPFRANHFVVLCTGDNVKKATYKDTKFFSELNKHKTSHVIIGGDYEYNNQTGGTALIRDVELKPYVTVKKEAGNVIVWCPSLSNKQTQFGLCLMNGNNVEEYVGYIGDIEQGLSQLINLVNERQTSQDIKVVDCGLLVSILDQ